MNTSGFDLVRLLETVFRPKAAERVGVFIDLPNPQTIRESQFLQSPALITQRLAHDVFYLGLLRQQSRLALAGVEFYAYEPTGGSNLELPPTVVNATGHSMSLMEVLSHLDIVLYFSTFSATAPLTALARHVGFRGATLHGCNEIILQSGLAKDYEEVSGKAERFRQAVTRCDEVVIELEAMGKSCRLILELARQEAQKSHGLCRAPGEIANLPAGEIYWVPSGAEGQFPMRLKEDGSLALMEVSKGRIVNASLLRGNARALENMLTLFREDPATGTLGELGLGTQVLPVAGADIQDEKILGTMHLATGRDDHLGGHLDPSKFKEKRNATHEDILFAPHKTPDIGLNGVWMRKDGQEVLLLKNYGPSDFVKQVAL